MLVHYKKNKNQLVMNTSIARPKSERSQRAAVFRESLGENRLDILTEHMTYETDRSITKHYQ